jgi:NAD(P)-dependent dehydrogenase (short-subunit alcohol dehydrogenase family)
MTRMMALEWGQKGIRTAATASPYFKTDMVKQIRHDPERAKYINRRTPMGRRGNCRSPRGATYFSRLLPPSS